MEGFSYTNIYDTKGIEYLVIIAFLILIIPFWRALNRPLKVKEAYREALGALTPEVLRIPQGFHYFRNHLWTNMKKAGQARIGLDDLLLQITGEIELHNFRKPGERVKKGDIIAEVNQGGKHLKISSPISGEVTGVNKRLRENPGVLLDDPYGKGWIYSMKPDDWDKDTEVSLPADKAKDWSRKELSRLKDFVADSLSKYSPEESKVVLQEGGELVQYPLSTLPGEAWTDFEGLFLKNKV